MKLQHAAIRVSMVAGLVLAQTSKRYCDSLTSICYSRWYGSNGVSFGVALPDVTAAPYETVLQIVSPIANGWVGFSWGGTMPYVPLTIGWVNNASDTAIYSSRMAFGLSLPQPYADAEYSYLKGTGHNETHWTLNVRCRGCSQWHDVDGKLVSIDPTNTAVRFAHGLSNRPPGEPANNRSTFNVHSAFGHWSLDLTQGQNADFNELVAANLVEDTPPTPSSSMNPSTTAIPQPSTLSTSVSSSATLAPTSTAVPLSCSGVSQMRFLTSTASGWQAVKVAGDLIQPRGLIFDSAGNLLLIQNGLGVTAHTIGPDGCLTSEKTVISQRNLNHGITLSNDGKTLYASSATSVFAWSYDAATMSVNGTSRVVVSGMDSRGHVTRTLTIPPKHPNLLVVSHGSNDNFDYASGNIKVGRSCVKVFDTSKTPTNGYDYVTGGYQMGYGLRNEVGLAFDADGMLWGVENASDEIHRTVNGESVDIHKDNPADEVNYLGDPSMENTQWYGYPTCYTIWRPSAIADTSFSVGDQFVLTPNATFSDDTCKSVSQPPSLTFQAHSAPLDACFNANFTAMYVTLHGSWNRDPPTGYKVVEIPFEKGGDTGYSPTAMRNSSQGYKDVFWNPEVEHCSTTQCFRPVSMARDSHGRMYITSDSGAEGEMIILGRG